MCVVLKILKNREKNKKEQENANKPIGKENPPQKGQYVRMIDNSNVVGRITVVQNNGVFSVKLIHVSPELEKQIESGQIVPLQMLQTSEQQKKSDYLFVQTVNNQKWQVVTRQKI